MRFPLNYSTPRFLQQFFSHIQYFSPSPKKCNWSLFKKKKKNTAKDNRSLLFYPLYRRTNRGTSIAGSPQFKLRNMSACLEMCLLSRLRLLGEDDISGSSLLVCFDAAARLPPFSTEKKVLVLFVQESVTHFIL